MTLGSHLAIGARFCAHMCGCENQIMGINRRALWKAEKWTNAGDSKSHWKWRVLWETCRLDFSEVGGTEPLESLPECTHTRESPLFQPRSQGLGREHLLESLDADREGGGRGGWVTFLVTSEVWSFLKFSGL